MSNKPDFIKENPWVDILSQRGKDNGKPTLSEANPPSSRPKPSDNTQGLRPVAAQKRGGPKRSKAAIDQRRKQVLELYLRGVDPEGISAELNCARRTISKDLLHLKEWLKIHFQKDRVASTNKALAQLDMLWRDLQQIYFSPIPAEGPDPAFRKIMAIDRMFKVLQLRTNLTSTLPETPSALDEDENYLDKLTEDEQADLARAITKLEATASPS